MTSETIQLNPRCTVSKIFYHSIHKSVSAALPYRKHGIQYTVKQLIGDKAWSTLVKIERIKAGFCVVHMVKNDLLPLHHVGENGSHSKLYCLK